MTEAAPPAAANPVYAPAPVAKKPRNALGIAALVIVIVAIFIPAGLFLFATFASLTGPQQTPDTGGWAILAGLVFGGIGFGVAGPVAIVGVILGIIALFRKAYGKVAAIVAIVLGAPLGLVGLFVLPLAIDQFF